VLAEVPLISLDRQAAVLADRHRATPAPLRRPLAHQLPSAGVNATALLVPDEGWGCGDKTSVETAEQQGQPRTGSED